MEPYLGKIENFVAKDGGELCEELRAFGFRLSRIEAVFGTLATKADIESIRIDLDMKADIESIKLSLATTEANIIKGFIATTIALSSLAFVAAKLIH